jgi:predicted aldo/keto reductase-like oxidoreductase
MVDRRTFIAGSAAAADAASSGGGASARDNPIPQRKLGRTNEMVSCIGLGGAHIGRVPDAAASARLIHAAIDRGITFLDNSWDYNDGKSEEWMGAALAQGGYRQRVFLMTKVDGRDKATATKQLDESLRRLKTDRLDLWQFHEVVRSNDPTRIFAPGGAYEAAVEAQRAGKIRYIGFTGHKKPAIHLEMLALAEEHGWTPDTVQMPVNVLDPHYDSFVRQVMPELVRRDIGVIGMKTFGDPHIYDAVTKAKLATPQEMLRFSLSQPTSVVVTGINTTELLDQAVAVATDFAPMTEAEMSELLERTRPLGITGQHQMMKIGFEFDSTHEHPEWLGPGGEQGLIPGQ